MSKTIEISVYDLQELRNENKNLNKQIEQFKKGVKAGTKIIERLEEENKKLNIKVASLEGEIKGLNSVIEKLKEENQYREDIADVLPEGKGHIAEETIQDLQARIKELNEDIKKIEESQEYRYHRCMKAERQVQHSLGGDDEEGLYD